MDPNKALEVIHAAIAKLGNPDVDVEEAWNNVDELLTHFVALDEWLRKGGFLPTEWAR